MATCRLRHFSISTTLFVLDDSWCLMKLTRSFFNIYFIIILSFILFSWLMDEIWRSYLEQDIESYTGYKFMLVAIGDYLQKHPEEEWESIVKGTNEKYHLPLSLMNQQDATLLLTNKDRSSLSQGDIQVSYDDDDVRIFYSLKSTEQVLALGPAKMPTRPRLEAFVRVVILAILGLLILIWLWPISKDLDGLRHSAKKLGEGDFDSQAPKARSTMMASMVRTFNMMSERIKRLVNAHQELTNAVAHELRTPLARSKFALQMLESVKDEHKQLKYRQQITSDIVELEALINEMLVYASFDSDKPEFNVKPIELGRLIEDQIASHGHYQGRINFYNEMINPRVNCDAHFIMRAFTNYLTNAEKYGDNLIKVTLKQVDEHYQLIVEDNGEGIPEQLKPVLFDAFSRGETSRNKETGGFGLGLAIVCRIMEWHQGRAWVEDSKLGGAAFNLTWPINLEIK